MFRHVVLLRWKPDATEAQRAAVVDGLEKLPGVDPRDPAATRSEPTRA